MQWRDATVGGMVDPRAARQQPDVSQAIGQIDQGTYEGSGYEGYTGYEGFTGHEGFAGHEGFTGRAGLEYQGQVGLADQFGSATAMSAPPVGLDLPCTDDPELFFAESPSDVEQAKAMCLGCRARLACLAGALERREPWGVWGGELLLRGVIVPHKRPRGRPRKTEQTEQTEPDKADVAA